MTLARRQRAKYGQAVHDTCAVHKISNSASHLPGASDAFRGVDELANHRTLSVCQPYGVREFADIAIDETFGTIRVHVMAVVQKTIYFEQGSMRCFRVVWLLVTLQLLTSDADPGAHVDVGDENQALHSRK